MDIVQLYMDYSVDFRTEGHKHCRPGWVNTPCPFCISEQGHEGYHLGYEIRNNRYTCWRCGWHPIIPTIAKLIQLTEREVYSLIKEYGLLIPKFTQITEAKFNTKEYRLPSRVKPLEANHIRYLENRGFDAEYLQKEYYIIGTGPVSLLDGLNYKFRIVLPFIWDGQEVSFDSRDITDKHPFKYLACPLEREKIPHKNIIYGKQEYWTDRIVIVEGPTDVWRFGFNSGATSGIKFTPKQMSYIAKNFKRAAVCFDDEPQAKKQADKLVSELKFRGVDSFRVDIKGDPGSMKQSEANYLVKQLIG